MKPLLAIQLIVALVGFLPCGAEAAEFDFYGRFTSLIETNRFGPALTNSNLSLSNIAQSGEIAGVKLGTGMSAAVERWGKPRNFYASCGGGPSLMFGHGTLNFRGNKVVRVSISPNTIPGLRFESGLTATNTPAQFANVLGLPVPGPARWELTFESTNGVMELRWNHFAVGGWQLSWLSFGPPEIAQAGIR